jgi:hypothetical protein
MKLGYNKSFLSNVQNNIKYIKAEIHNFKMY